MNRLDIDILDAMRYHWELLNTFDIILEPPDLFLLHFDHENELQLVLTEGPWAIYGQMLMLHKFKLGTSPHTSGFDSFFVWMMFLGLPFLRRNEEDISLLLKDILPVFMVKPKKSPK